MKRLFGRYKDEELVARAEQALAEDPMVDLSHLEVLSEDGVVTLRGKLASSVAKRHALEAVHRHLELSGLKYDKIEDEIEVV